jgi:predicted MFS family arabinose efflux permease
MILVVRVREPAPPVPSTRTTAQLLRDLWGSVRSQGPWLWLFLAYAKFGETLGGALVKPMLVDLEFSRSFIGLIDGVFGSVATIAGAGLGGWLSQRHSWALTITAFTVIQGLALAQLGIAQASGVGVVGIASLLVVENFAGGGVAVGIFALAMSRCDRDVGASQFTMAQVVYMSGALLAAPLGGWVADITGYLPVMVLSGGLALLLAPVALVMRRRLRAPAT